MPKANIHDRSTIENAYTRAAFARDAARNALASSEIVHGVRVGSAPDANGWFQLQRTARHVGEPQSPDFLAPVHRAAELVDQGRTPSQAGKAEPQAGYGEFLSDIVTAAKRYGFRPEDAPGRTEPRLRGFRGG
jgi:hypothetical protein